MTEQQIQKAVFAHLKQRAIQSTFFWHPFSGGFRKPKEAAIYKGLGAIAGLPDVMVLYEGKTFGLELKADNGKLSDTQRNTIEAMRAAGATIGVAHGIDEALRWLEGHRLLRGKAA
jgi:hypothetical protein